VSFTIRPSHTSSVIELCWASLPHNLQPNKLALLKGRRVFSTKHYLIGIKLSLLISEYSNAQEQCWVWNNEGTEYFYDKHEWVRVRVEQEHWHDQSPVAPAERESAAAQERISPFSITVCALIALEKSPANPGRRQ